MDPKHLEWMAGAFAHGRYHHCPDGSHLAIYDDQKSWFEGVLRFLRDVDSGAF
jgi:proline iminopeptidase